MFPNQVATIQAPHFPAAAQQELFPSRDSLTVAIAPSVMRKIELLFFARRSCGPGTPDLRRNAPRPALVQHPRTRRCTASGPSKKV
jgi:hypothetical protein